MKTFQNLPLTGAPLKSDAIRHFYLVLALVITLLGLWAGFSDKLLALVTLWKTDPLRSVGCLMPLAAIFFAWKRRQELSWEQGNWWGLALMALPLVWMWLTGGVATLSGLIKGHYVALSLSPIGLLLVLYLSGSVLFFGGVSALKRLRFPLFLLLFVNPVPGVAVAFDLELQTIAAKVARGFAGLLALPVEPGLLTMMFAPNLGMFIAPGCNGLRGVAAMFCLSMIVGHYYQMTAKHHALYVLTSVLLAYVLNLVRLCCVVIYYGLALHINAIADLGTEIDYAIGGVLFFVAAFFVFGYPRKMRATIV